MPVVSSSFTTEAPQKDGRFWMTETHTWGDGTVSTFSTFCNADIDPKALMQNRAASLNAAEAAQPPPDQLALKIAAAQAAESQGDMAATKQALSDAATLANAASANAAPAKGA